MAHTKPWMTKEIRKQYAWAAVLTVVCPLYMASKIVGEILEDAALRMITHEPRKSEEEKVYTGEVINKVTMGFVYNKEAQ